MAARHVVVDGSNLATEGRSMPSLAQLDQAVREFLTENPEDVVTVVVDASFGHRIDSSESRMFEEAEEAGELVSPPAGAIGRGDAFLLRIADKTGATVLSNDSFQEFHGDYDWLFERGRLIGGKPVPGVGWIFTPRTPVRGPRSREAVKEAKRKTTKEPESAKPGLDLAAERARTKGQGKGKKNVERAIAVALEEAVAPKDKPNRRRKGGSPPADPVNDPLSFITFIAAHPLGAEVTATVESFASHGAFVDCEGARCYVPLSAMGNPPPKSAREIFGKGQEVRFVVQALDPQRRGVELAVPGFAKIAGAPTDETVAAEIEGRAEDEAEGLTTVAPPARRTRKKAAPAPEPASEQAAPPVKKSVSRRRASPVAPDGSMVADSALPAPAGVASMQAGPQQTPIMAVDAAAAPTPARRAPRRRSPLVAPEASVEVAPASGGDGDAPEPASRSPRRRASRAASLGSAEAAVATDAEAPAPPPVGPTKRRPQSSRTAGVDQHPPAPPSSLREGAAKTANTARRRGAGQGAQPGSGLAGDEASGGAASVSGGSAEPALSPARASRRRAPAAPPAELIETPEPVQAAHRARRGRAPAVPAAESVPSPEPVQAAARPKRGRATAASATPAAPAAAVGSLPATPDPAPASSTVRRRRAPAATPAESAEPVARPKPGRSPQRPPT